MMSAAEDLVKHTARAAENPVNHNIDATENPINGEEGAITIPSNEKASSSVNPGNDKAAVADNPASDQSDGAVNPVNNQVGHVESPINDQACDVVSSINVQGCGAENPARDQAGSAVNPANDQACGEKNLANDHSDVAVNPVDGQACGAENLANDQAGGAEKPVNHEAGDAENLANDQAGGVEKPVSHEAGGAENLANDQAGGAEEAVNQEAGGAVDPSNKQADAAENPVNDKEGAAVEEKGDFGTPVSNKVDCLPVEAREILKSLAGQWEDVLDENALQVVALKGAMTNEVYQIKWPTASKQASRKVLVRIYGQGVDIFFDRDDEIRTFEFMSKNGQGPRLLDRFTNGRVEEFINARTLSASDLRDPSISALIAAKMKEFHDLNMPGEKKVYLWDRLRNWLGEAKRLSSPQEVEAFYLDTIDKEISVLEKELSGPDQQIGFCHNDLQYGNIMLDEETNSVTIIDYEYASYNPVAYDIANHFCEMAANYHTETPHVLDYDKYPDFEERQRFVLAYLNSSGEEPRDSEVEQLLQEIEKYTLANHLFWGIWGIISAQVNKIDFDYKEYAKQRFQEYWARKPYLLISSDAPSPYNMPEGTGI